MKKDIYIHYKNKKTYEFLGIGHHTETLEELVCYKALYDDEKFGENSLWCRPKDMFFDNVEYEGKMVERFKLVKDV